MYHETAAEDVVKGGLQPTASLYNNHTPVLAATCSGLGTAFEAVDILVYAAGASLKNAAAEIGESDWTGCWMRM